MQVHLIAPAGTANIPRKENPMKLYYSPGACSLSPHIALLEAGLAHELVKVDLRAKKLENGDDFLKVNPKGQVPVLALDSGELVTEGPVIVQMIADKAAAKNLAPARDSAERYKLQEWLNYINGTAQEFRPAVQAGDGRRRQGVLQGPHHGQVQICRQRARRPGLSDGQAVHRRRRLSVHDAGLGRADEVRPVRAAEPDGLQGPRRRAPEGAGSADQGRPDEGGGVSFRGQR